MNSKYYEFTGSDQTLLRRMRATRDLPQHGVLKGDIGGFVQGRSNLSGGAWVKRNATVAYGAKAEGFALIDSHAKLSGNARVSGYAHVYGNARIYDNADVKGNAKIGGEMRVYGDARVSGNAHLTGDALILGSAVVTGAAELSEFAQIGGQAYVTTPAEALEYAYVSVPPDFIAYLRYIEEKTFGNLKVLCGYMNNVHKIVSEDTSPRCVAALLNPAIEEFGIAHLIPNGWEENVATIERRPRIGMMLEVHGELGYGPARRLDYGAYLNLLSHYISDDPRRHPRFVNRT
ncbi:MAG: hypothetical protein DRJ03_10930 [Chloroflexi bacterium]|nr:MAG: hypothetical protein DRJ03_10930 [Chloroflexota bacterium]